MFKVGQKVWCLIYGQGVVAEVDDDSPGGYCIEVIFNNSLSVYYTSDGKHFAEGNTVLFPYPVEVVKSVTKPSIDWSHVSPEYNYLAQDSNGKGYLSSKEPSCHTYSWSMETPYIRATTFTSYEPGTCNWKDSLVKRPE